MKSTADSETVCFTAGGRIAIPRRYCRVFRIGAGTRAVVTSTSEGILIKPVTSGAIARGFGLLKRESGKKSFAERWAEHKREEIALEERKHFPAAETLRRQKHRG